MKTSSSSEAENETGTDIARPGAKPPFKRLAIKYALRCVMGTFALGLFIAAIGYLYINATLPKLNKRWVVAGWAIDSLACFYFFTGKLLSKNVHFARRSTRY